MKRASRAALFAAFIALATVAVALATFVQQRDQIAVTIIVNVTPAPRMAAYAPTATTGSDIRAAFTLDTKRAVRAGAISLNNLVAQNQQAVRVEASVQPNPLGTLLVSNQNSVTINATAGTTVVVPCAYTVTVDTTITYWELYDGLFADFSSTFPGNDLANNTYITTPLATATPFFVYSDNGGHWAALETSGGIKTYCVDLTLTIPVSVSGGTYSTNAVYTLYY
uniref:Uncharacterized protein n=1 Tax=mine drainage metagenome TaxID=410659 RepID=E6Q476_9ZZZZ